MRDAMIEGARAALFKYGTTRKAHHSGSLAALVKFAFVDGIMHAARLGAIGQAPEVFAQGARAIGPGGALHYGNVLWPTIPGNKLQQTLGRGSTLFQAAMLPGMVKRDRQQGEGMLSSVLGSAGSLVGSMYGGTAAGLLGMPLGSAVGHRLGQGLGHLLGSPAAPPQGAV
jgi:hypothetical protein